MSKYYPNNNEQIQFLINILEITQNSRGLDLGCEDGCHLKELQKISKNIYGVDILDQENLDNFTKLNFFKDSIPLQDLDFVYCLAPYFVQDWWNLQYLLKNINQSLKLNGYFVLDLFEFNSRPIDSQKHYFVKNDNNTILSLFTRQKDRMLLERTIIDEQGKEEIIEGLWRVFDYQTIAEELYQAGFAIVNQYSSFRESKDVNWENGVEGQRIILKTCKFR